MMDAMSDAKQALSTLTKSQRQVAILRASGFTATEIADRLSRNEQTVKTHLYMAFKRLGITRSTELAVICTLAGEVTDWRAA